MTQPSLFQLRVRRHQLARGKGRSLLVEGVAEDGLEYALKRQSEGALLPATEFLCYRLAAACALATPASAVLIDLDGSVVFGSRIEGGIVETEVLDPAARISELEGCADRISACFALDLLLGNEDRHFGNLLFRRRADGLLAAVVIDYNNALWFSGWPPVAGRATMTANQLQFMRAVGLWRPVDALTTLGKASSIRVSDLSTWIEAMPSQWMPLTHRKQLLDWWASEAFHQHISHCIELCK